MNKIPVYFVPGMAASTTIFERINLPKETFEMFFIEWFLPNVNETLQSYAKRMSKKVNHENAILIGVSFGGVLVQEMAQFLNVKKIIIISSVKCNSELPQRMKIAKATKAYKLLPTSLLQDIEMLAKFAFGDTLKRKLKLYETFLQMRDKKYLDWAIEQMICWQRNQIDIKVVHIHGDIDEVFPPKNINNFIPVKGGTHAMILTKFKWFNSNLPQIILKD